MFWDRNAVAGLGIQLGSQYLRHRDTYRIVFASLAINLDTKMRRFPWSWLSNSALIRIAFLVICWADSLVFLLVFNRLFGPTLMTRFQCRRPRHQDGFTWSRTKWAHLHFRKDFHCIAEIIRFCMLSGAVFPDTRVVHCECTVLPMVFQWFAIRIQCNWCSHGAPRANVKIAKRCFYQWVSTVLGNS